MIIMKENLESMLAEVTQFLKSEANTETVVGKEFKLGEYYCVPVIRIGLGFGYGGNEAAPPAGQSSKSGGGAGLGLDPVGFLVSRGDEISFIPTRNSKGMNAAIEKIPDILEKFISKKL